MQLPHPLRLHCEIATDFRDLPFDCIRQFRGWAPRRSPRRATNDFGLRHIIPSCDPILTGWDADVCPLWNGTRLDRTIQVLGANLGVTLQESIFSAHWSPAATGAPWRCGGRRATRHEAPGRRSLFARRRPECDRASLQSVHPAFRTPSWDSSSSRRRPAASSNSSTRINPLKAGTRQPQRAPPL